MKSRPVLLNHVSAETGLPQSDPAHPYFDEVYDEMVPLTRTGMSLQEAYEKASLNCTTQKVDTQTVKNCR